MIKALELVSKIKKRINDDCSDLLEAVNLHNEFKPIYNMGQSFFIKNALICFIVYAYDPDSQWIDTRKDRYENKIKILSSLECDHTSEFFKEIIINRNFIINSVIAEYLIDLADARWHDILTLLEYHSSMIRFAKEETDTEKSVDKMSKDGNQYTLTQEYDIDKIAKTNLLKGDLFEKAISAREKADKLKREIKTDFNLTDHATQSDFGVEFTDVAKKRDIYSWRAWIKEVVVPLRESKQQ